MDRRTYMLYFVIGLSVALIAGAVFADKAWQSVAGATAGIVTFIIGFFCAEKE